LTLFVLLAALPATVRANFVPSVAEERAQRAKISKGLPAEALAAISAYPGAKLDAACSVSRWDGETDYYVLRTPDPPDRVAAPRAAAEKRRDGITALAASPPDPATLGRPLPPDAVFDADRTYDRNPEPDPNFERIVCYRITAANYQAAYQQLLALDVRAGSWERNVIVRIEEKPAPVRLQYWIGRGGPEKPRVAAATTASGAAAPKESAPAGTAPSTAPAPAAPPVPNPADAAKKAVDKLRGLFGR
jgi:hypothetical protein